MSTIADLIAAEITRWADQFNVPVSAANRRVLADRIAATVVPADAALDFEVSCLDCAKRLTDEATIRADEARRAAKDITTRLTELADEPELIVDKQQTPCDLPTASRLLAAAAHWLEDRDA